MSIAISVIIPVYNAEKRLNNLFKQINNQTLDNRYYEIIFVDDGSTDSSVELLNNYAKEHKNIKVLVQENKKQAEARNNGIRNASGNYVMFVDDDDIIDVDYFQRFYENSHGENAVYSKIDKIFPNGKNVEEPTIIHNNCHYDKSKLLNNYLSQGLESDNGVWAKMYNLEFIRRNNIYFENANFFEDSLFNFEVFMYSNVSKLKAIDYCGYKLVKHPESTTTSFKPELDALVERYISKVKKLIKSSDVDKINLKSFVAREYVYVVHHHMKYDSYKGAKEISKNINKLSFLESMLTLKYKVSTFMISFLFPLYYCLYNLRTISLFRKG